ncbi:MAG: hypothetical protein HY320_14305 [Armatimonadetes bacterium]|nr:hypothetical protein [Armatimonadota bacterium]
MQKRNAVDVDVATETLGYKARSSQATRAIAALLSYGLLHEEGSGTTRKVKLSELGRRIVMLEGDDPDRLEAIRQAAVTPKIYREIKERWPEDLPSDSAIAKFLKVEKEYNPDVVDGLIRDFRHTWEFAKLGHDDTLSNRRHADTDGEEDGTEPASEPGEHPRHAGADAPRGPIPARAPMAQDARGNSRVLHIPLPRTRLAILEVPTDLSEKDVNFLTKYIEIMRDAIIGEVTGRHYVSVEGSRSGIPLDEISSRADTAGAETDGLPLTCNDGPR